MRITLMCLGNESNLLKLGFEFRILQILAQDCKQEINDLFEVTITVNISNHCSNNYSLKVTISNHYSLTVTITVTITDLQTGHVSAK
jgi:hypothetical protein